jgi:hypothetical protein
MTSLTKGMALALVAIVPAGSVATAAVPAIEPHQHYKCYAAKGTKLEDVTVTTSDTVDGTPVETQVLKPVYYCDPVAKTVGTETSPVLDPALRYVCYSIKAPKAEPTDIDVTNQFQDTTLTTKTPKLLCVPRLSPT